MVMEGSQSQMPEISRPIRGSFIHTGHGSAGQGESWGDPGRIDPIYLTNPMPLIEFEESDDPAISDTGSWDDDRSGTLKPGAASAPGSSNGTADSWSSAGADYEDDFSVEGVQFRRHKDDGRLSDGSRRSSKEAYYSAPPFLQPEYRRDRSSTATELPFTFRATHYLPPPGACARGVSNDSDRLATAGGSSRPVSCPPQPQSPLDPVHHEIPPQDPRPSGTLTSPVATAHVYNTGMGPTGPDPFEIDPHIKRLTMNKPYSQLDLTEGLPPSKTAIPTVNYTSSPISNDLRFFSAGAAPASSYAAANAAVASLTMPAPASSQSSVPSRTAALYNLAAPPASPARRSRQSTSGSGATAMVVPEPAPSQSRHGTSIDAESMHTRHMSLQNGIQGMVPASFFTMGASSSSQQRIPPLRSPLHYFPDPPAVYPVEHSRYYISNGLTPLSYSARANSVPNVSEEVKPSAEQTKMLLNLFDPICSSASSAHIAHQQGRIHDANRAASTSSRGGRSVADFKSNVARVRASAQFASDAKCERALLYSNNDVDEAIHNLRIEKLVDLGIASKDAVRRALADTNWDMDRAASALLGTY